MKIDNPNWYLFIDWTLRDINRYIINPLAPAEGLGDPYFHPAGYENNTQIKRGALYSPLIQEMFK